MSIPINDSSYWREFERNDITHSAAHYLMAIDALREEYGYARVTDVADMLKVSRGAA
jgi:Mn-dependent DtxR family transcriptional regulator